VAGAWFERGDVRVHLGVEKNFQPARKAHVGFLVDDIRTRGDEGRLRAVLARQRRVLETPPTAIAVSEPESAPEPVVAAQARPRPKLSGRAMRREGED